MSRGRCRGGACPAHVLAMRRRHKHNITSKEKHIVPYRMIQVGTGGFGGWWCKNFLPPNVKDGLIEVVAAVDLNPAALQNAREGLGLRDDQCYTDLKTAFDACRADFCTVVVPPAFHEEVVDMALAHDMHILSEKPIADTLAASVRIAEKVKRAG